MAAVPMESVSPRSEQLKELDSEGSAILQSCSVAGAAALAPNDPVGVATAHVNNSLQALTNLFYLIAREARIDPQLQPLVTQIQAELAQLSRRMKKLGPLAHCPHTQSGGVK